MKLDGFVNECRDFCLGFAGRHSAGEVRDVCAKAGGAVFDDDEVLHGRSHFRTSHKRHLAEHSRLLFNLSDEVFQG